MRKNYISVFIKAVFRLTLIFIALLVWTRYYINDSQKAIIAAAIGTLLIDLIIYIITKKISTRRELSIKQQKHCELVFTQFLLSSKEKIISFFYDFFTESFECTKTKNFIKDKKGEVVFYPFFENDSLTISSLLAILNTTKAYKEKKLIIIAFNISRETENFASRINRDLILLNKEEAYASLLEPKQKFPELKEEFKKEKKQTFFEAFNAIFNRKRAKTFAFCGITLFLASLIIPKNIYYVVMSSILIMFALISLFNFKANKIKTYDFYKNVTTTKSV